MIIIITESTNINFKSICSPFHNNYILSFFNHIFNKLETLSKLYIYFYNQIIIFLYIRNII